VRDSIQRGVPLAELVQAHPHLGTDALELLEPGVAVTRRTSPGGAGPKPVAVQLERFRHRLDLDRQRVTHAAEAVGKVSGPGSGSRSTSAPDADPVAGGAPGRAGAAAGRGRKVRTTRSARGTGANRP
jgi:hypothetical protein